MTQRPPWVDARLQRTDRPLTKVHLDYHNTEHVGVVADGFDADQFVDALRRGGVEAIVVFAKDMHGWFYYPAERSDAVHPGLDRDLLGEQVAACRRAGIKVYAYYCVTWDHRLAEQHPDWLVVKRDRTTYLPGFDETPGWTALCLRNPDFVDLSLRDTEDLLRRYELDGVWFDMPFPIGGECYCHLCLAALRERGLDPLDRAVQRADKQELWVDWQRRSHELAQKLRPGCDVDQNNNTRLGLGDRVPFMSNVDIEALPTGGWGYHYFPVDVRYARTFGAPVTGMTGRFVRSWADFGGLKTAHQLTTEMALIVAQGAQICVGDQPPPDGRLDSAVYDVLGEAYGWVQRGREHLVGAAPVVEAAIVAAGELLADPGATAAMHGESDAGRWGTSVVGAADLLQRHRVQFDVVEPGSALERYRLLVVPGATRVDAELAAQLLAHRDAGGALIVLGPAVRAEDGGSWVPGISDRGPSDFSTPFLRPTAASTGIAAFDYALYGGAERLDADGGQVLATLVEPAFERSPEHFTSHGYSPPAVPTDFAVAWHRDGLGVLAFDAGTDQLTSGYWVYAELFGQVLDAVLPQRLVRSAAPDPVSIALTRRTQDGRPETVVHLTPAVTERHWGSRPDAYAAGVVLADVELTVAVDHPVTSATCVHGGSATVEPDGTSVRIRMERLDGPELVILR